MAQTKEYTGTFTLGATTPTYDSESNPENFKDYSNITDENITNATKNFIGEIQQFPPIYSAIKKMVKHYMNLLVGEKLWSLKQEQLIFMNLKLLQ